MIQSEATSRRFPHASRRFGLGVFLFVSVCCIAISLVFFFLSVVKPFTGVDLAFDGREWEVQSVEDNGLGSQSGMTVGDRPVTVNGQGADIFLRKYEDAGIVFGNLIQEMTVVDQFGQTKSLKIAGASSSLQSAMEPIAWFLVSSVFWAVGFFALRRSRARHTGFLLCVSALVFGLTLSANTAGTRNVPFAVETSVAAAVFFPWVLLHFFMGLPEENARLRASRFTYVLYLAPAVTLLLFFLVGYVDGQPVQWFRVARLIEYGVGLLAVLGIVIWNYFGAASVRTKLQMRVVTFSCLVALVPPVVFYLLPSGIWGQPIVPGTMSALFVAFIPLGMGYAVITQQLMDIDFVIRRGVIYGLVTIIMAVLLSAAIFPVALFRPSLGIAESILIALVLGAIATALFGPIRQMVETFVDRVLYKDRYDYRQIIHDTSSALNLLREFPDISRLVVRASVETLNLAGGCLYYRSQTGVYTLSAAQGLFVDVGTQDRLLDMVSSRFMPGRPRSEEGNELTDIAYVLPLTAGDKEVGVLVLSHKVSRQRFSNDDMFLLQSLASLAALALHRASLIRDVSMRDTFVSIASHELRTPLTAILGYADLLLRRDPPEETRRRWLATLLENSNRISAMVDDLLNVSRIQSGRVSMKLDSMRLRDVLEECVSLVRETDTSHEFVADIADDLPDLLGDRTKLGQVVGNLLSNAIKYSPGGGRITLAAGFDKELERVVISVSDQGIGISPEDRGSLFTTFHRIQRPETVGIRGSGLGLYIAKEWTEAMGGKIWLESEVNKGSTFFVGLPAGGVGR